MIVSCPLCGFGGTSSLFESRDRVHRLSGVFTIYQCAHCRAVFIHPWLNNEELTVYYPDHYSGYRHSRSLDRRNYTGLRRFVLEHYYDYPSLKNENVPFFKTAAAFLLSFVMAKRAIPYRGDGRFLDVGCGGGSYLHRLRQWGWKVYGVEPSESGVKQARALGLDVRHGELTDVHFPDCFFDCVRLNNVLEHLVNPQETFREAHRILKPHGLVYITVPNTRSLTFWLFGEDWFGLDAPRHVISYCPKALSFLCAATGFEIVKIRFPSGPFNFVRSVKYLLEERGRNWPIWLHRIDWPRNRLIRRTLKPFFFLVDRMGIGDVMMAILRRGGLSSE